MTGRDSRRSMWQPPDTWPGMPRPCRSLPCSCRRSEVRSACDRGRAMPEVRRLARWRSARIGPPSSVRTSVNPGVLEQRARAFLTRHAEDPRQAPWRRRSSLGLRFVSLFALAVQGPRRIDQSGSERPERLSAEFPFETSLSFACSEPYRVFELDALRRQSNQTTSLVRGVDVAPYVSHTLEISEKVVDRLLRDLHLIGELGRPSAIESRMPEQGHVCAVHVHVPRLLDRITNVISHRFARAAQERADPWPSRSP